MYDEDEIDMALIDDNVIETSFADTKKEEKSKDSSKKIKIDTENINDLIDILAELSSVSVSVDAAVRKLDESTKELKELDVFEIKKAINDIDNKIVDEFKNINISDLIRNEVKKEMETQTQLIKELSKNIEKANDLKEDTILNESDLVEPKKQKINKKWLSVVVVVVVGWFVYSYQNSNLAQTIKTFTESTKETQKKYKYGLRISKGVLFYRKAKRDSSGKLSAGSFYRKEIRGGYYKAKEIVTIENQDYYLIEIKSNIYLIESNFALIQKVEKL